MMLDYKDDKLVYIMAGEQKELFTLIGQCLIILSKWQRGVYLSSRLDLVCGSYFETQQTV